MSRDMFTDDDLRELGAPRASQLYAPSTYRRTDLRDDDESGSAIEPSRYAVDPTMSAAVRAAFERSRCDELWRSRSFTLACDACGEPRDFFVEDRWILCGPCLGRRRRDATVFDARLYRRLMNAANRRRYFRRRHGLRRYDDAHWPTRRMPEKR